MTTLRESASSYIWALVSGLPGKRRTERQLLMLQAYIDGSATQGRNILVLAGYIAKAETWAKFSDDWQELLDNRPLRLRDQTAFKFNRVKSKSSIKRAEQFYRIIEKHVSNAIVCVIFVDGLSELIEGSEWAPYVEGIDNLKNPYFFAFKAIIDVMLQHQRSIGITEPIDFIFDNESEKTKCLEGWDYWKLVATPEQRTLMGDTPAFKNDDEILPLQAADLLSGYVRKWYQDGNDRSQAFQPNFQWKVEKIIPTLAMGFDAKAIMASFDRIYPTLLSIARVVKPWQKYGV